jgi:glycosyltransferase involved in cell wall biosynthesis
MQRFFLYLTSFLFLCFSTIEAQKTIGIFTFSQTGLNPWDPNSIQSGISGSEEAVIYMSEKLAKLGYHVTVFGEPPKDSPYSTPEANPRFVSWEFSLPAKLDIGIVWRIPQAGENLKKFANTLYLWPHDAVDAMTLNKQQILAFDDVLWLSDWQRESWAAKYPEFTKFTHIFGNGIEPHQFPSISAKENPYSCIYASNYGRGLEELVTLWPQIKEQFPKATLDIYYGWNHWGLLSPEKEKELRKKIQELEPLAVKEHGMVGHEELAKAFEKASFWTYPCTALETFCITALKAQLAGAIPVICKHSGLTETCRAGFSCSTTSDYFPLLVQAMNQAEQISLESRKNIGQFVLEKFTWEKIAKKWEELFEASAKKKICLNMVIKDHEDSIARSLNSIKDKIDYWVIVDTGSTDRTINILQNTLEGIPGELHQATGSNPHQQALALTKADYILLLDPEEELFFSNHFSWKELDQDYYCGHQKQKELLIKNSLPWVWSEVLQKRLTCPEAKTFKVLPGVLSSLEFSSSQNLSLAFAQSYIEAQDYPTANTILDSLIQTQSAKDSLYLAFYLQGILSELLQKNLEEVLDKYSRAYIECPNKAEPLFRMSVYAFNKNHYTLAYALAKQAIAIPKPQNEIGHEEWIYEYGLPFNLGNCASLVKKYEEAKLAYEQALSSPHLSKEIEKEILENLQKIKNLIPNH